MKRLAAALGCMLTALALAGCSAESWYARIDNDKVSSHDTGGNPVDLSGSGHLEYSYTLPAFNASGKEQDITFGSDRILKDGHYIQLDLEPVRGVVSWQEAAYDDLPPAARQALEETGATD